MTDIYLCRGKVKKTGEWILGYPLVGTSEANSPRMYLAPVLNTAKYNEYTGNFIFGDFIEVIPQSVGRNINLQDSKGTDIFVGDILSVPSDKRGFLWVVEESRGGFVLKKYDHDKYGDISVNALSDPQNVSFTLTNTVVVGNVFDGVDGEEKR